MRSWPWLRIGLLAGLIALALLAAAAFLPRLVKRMRGATSWLTVGELATQ